MQASINVDGKSFVKFGANFDFCKALATLLATLLRTAFLEYRSQIEWDFKFLGKTFTATQEESIAL